MDVVYAPGRVIASWAVVPSRFHDTSLANSYVRSLAKRISGQLEMLYPGSQVVFQEDVHGASFSVSNENIDELDAVRADLDGAVARFHQGACDNLLTGTYRRPPRLAAAMSQNVSSP